MYNLPEYTYDYYEHNPKTKMLSFIYNDQSLKSSKYVLFISQ